MLHLRNLRFKTSLGFAIAITSLALNACGDDDDAPPTGKGGSTASGGKGGGTGGGGRGGASGGTRSGGTSAGGSAGDESAGTGGISEAGSAGLGGSSGSAGEGGGGAAGDTGNPIAGSGGEGGADPGLIESYNAVLSGAEEVPPVDTAATGKATLSYDPSTKTLSWSLTHNATNVTAAHIHLAPPGEEDAPIIDIDVSSTPAVGSQQLTTAQQDALRDGHLYVNVHSSAQEDGEIRGQILRPGDSLWVAQLSAAQEVPTNTSAGVGVASLIVNAAHTWAHYHLSHSLTATQAHIHTGIAGVSGPVRFPLTMSGAPGEGEIEITQADYTALDRTQLYVNVHTAAFPMGEIRGQLLRPGSWLYTAKLTGDQEVPAVVSTGTGNASVALDYRSRTLRYALTTTLTPTQAHIHNAIAGVNGPVLVPFGSPGTETFGTAEFPNATNIDLLTAGRLYVNVHTAANTNGELRGQLMEPGERLYTASLDGAQEVPPVITTGTGKSQFILNAAGNALRYSSEVSGIVDATAAHIHSGAVGVSGNPVIDLNLTGLNPIGTAAVTQTHVTNLNNSAYYVNIHSTLHAAGEIRGQIVPRN